jgi:glycosyltransferase involved in cell wall biosynthesis
MHLQETPATVLYNGVDPAFLQPIDRDQDRALGPGPHIGITAQIIPWKGQDIFLEAASRLVERFPTARFYVIGGLAFPEDQAYLDRLRTMANRPALAGRVTFTGFQTDMPSWINAMDVIALCSVEDEAQPMAVLEAMALRKKVVGTNIGGTPEIIKDRVTGRLVPPGDSEAMADAIAESLLLPASDSRGENARRDVEARFTAEIFGRNLAQLYADTLNGRRPELRNREKAPA